MAEEQRVQRAWQRIERWLAGHAPKALAQLNGPASESAIAEAERQLGLMFPAALRASFRVHDGEAWGTAVLGDGHWLLSVEECVLHWGYEKGSTSPEERDFAENAASWRAAVETGVMYLTGPVKPMLGSPGWVPITSLNGDVLRYVDFDPAPGGTPGQIIEVDRESMMWHVLAPSFLDFLEGYADAFERGHYIVSDDEIRTAPGTERRATPGLLPAYLQTVTIEPYDPTAYPPPTIANLELGEEVTLVGETGWLSFSTEKIFSFYTQDGVEHVLFAQPGVTKGYSAIGVQQKARIKATLYTGQPASELMAEESLPPIELLALEYTLLR